MFEVDRPMTIISRALTLDNLRVANLRAFAAMLDAEAVAWDILEAADKRSNKGLWKFQLTADARRSEAAAFRLSAEEIEMRNRVWREGLDHE
jgi:hypothetical protein